MKAVSIVVCLAGWGFALSLANCSQSACSSNAATAGSAGSSDCSTSASAGSGGAAATTCDELSAREACLSTFCAADGIGSPFCTCYARGFDLKAPSSDATSCTCIAINATSICAQATLNGLDGSEVDCNQLTSPLISMCVGVQ
jgi:hypothetical protein